MTLLDTETIGLAHEEMSTEELYESLREIAENLGYGFSEFEGVRELESEFGVYGAIEVMAEESDKKVVLDAVTNPSFSDDIWSGHVIGAKAMEVSQDE